jgi:HTH-type transcriptional regulator/antitoxin HigA
VYPRERKLPAQYWQDVGLGSVRRPRLLRNEREYDAAVAELDELLDQDPPEGTDAFDRLEFLSVLIETYDEEHHAIPEATPQDVIDFLLEQRGMARADLADVLGGRSRVVGILQQ